ncbi:response regulator transcription factor [Amycolatopsis sp. NPDC059657]|uniref:helix-turn-helix transcriptional regulator n=1 Tax=Amycolatopsis sp. NPDC059657 TaxID=3346899 RepID=UPI00366DD914
MDEVRVAVCAVDPITRAGLVNCLETRPGLTVVETGADVVVAGFHRFCSGAVAALRGVTADVPVVLLVNGIKEPELLAAIECRVVAILPRAAAADERLGAAVHAAAADRAELPPNLLGPLVTHLERLHREVLRPNGLVAGRLTEREIDVLRLMADGLDTDEIARSLRYSERTVKNIIYAVTRRLSLRNRSHAVAYAMRAGVI